MRAVVLRSLAVIGVGGLILAGVLYVASTVDARPPQVLGVTLTQATADDPDRALITTSIEVEFSEPVEPESAARAFAIAPDVPGSVSWSGATMTFTPAGPLELETTYEVSIGPGVRDLAGNEMGEPPAPYAFVTAGRPALAASDPVDGAVDVPIGTTIQLDFSTLMDTASVEGALTLEPAVPHDLRWSGERLEIVPRAALHPGSEYLIRLGRSAADVAGVAIGETVTVAFRTVAPGLEVRQLVPAAESEGIAPGTPIAAFFDRPIDPDSLDGDLFEISPSVSGSIEAVSLSDDPQAPTVVRFTPSAPLPANTTFEIELQPGITDADGVGTLAAPMRWNFTTGAPQSTLSNQVLFLSARSGVANVWAMNPDGTGQHQVSAELTPVLDYAAAPNGSSLVVGDGRRLVFLRADGSGRQVLTEDGHLEFDPAYAPDGTRVAFARADAESAEGLGLWTWVVGAGSATALEVPPETRSGSSPDVDPPAAALRAPRYAPDSQALAFVDMRGSIGILELPAERLTRIPGAAAGPPTWRPNSSGLLVAVGDTRAGEPRFIAPVEPLRPDRAAGVGLVNRSGTRMEPAGFDDGSVPLAIGVDGTIAYRDANGMLWLTATPGEAGEPVEVVEGAVDGLAFGPAGRFAIVVTGPLPEAGGTIERVDLETGMRTQLVRDGWDVRWLP